MTSRLSMLAAATLALAAAAQPAWSKAGHFFAQPQLGRPYDAAGPTGTVSRWQDAPCGSSFDLATSGRAAQRWSLDWRRVTAVSVTTRSARPNDPAAGAYRGRRGVVLAAKGGFTTAGRRADSFEFILSDPARANEMVRTFESLRRACA